MKKKPTRRSNYTYWNPEQFTKLQAAPPIKLASKGNLTWRWLAYLLEANPQVQPIRDVISRRLADAPHIRGEFKRLSRMLVTLHQMGVVVLDPPPPPAWQNAVKPGADPLPPTAETPAPVDDSEEDEPNLASLLGKLKLGATAAAKKTSAAAADDIVPYEPLTATPTPKLKQLTVFRAVHPLYGVFLMDYLAKADRHELIQILESLLAMPGSVAKSVRVPWPDRLPPGRLATEVLDPALLTSGLATQDDLYPPQDQSDLPPELRKYPHPPRPENAHVLREHDRPRRRHVHHSRLGGRRPPRLRRQLR